MVSKQPKVPGSLGYWHGTGVPGTVRENCRSRWVILFYVFYVS
jgi:hypothetical protein